MAPILGNAQGGQDVDLAVATSESLLQIAQLLIGRQTARKLKKFYAHLMGHCIFVSDNVNRVRFIVGPDNELIVRILTLFESLIAPKATPGTTGRAYPRQRALNHRWDSLQNQNIKVKLEYAEQCLNFGQPSDQPPGQDFDESLDLWEENFTAKYPEDGSQRSFEEHQPPKQRRPEPSYTVPIAAQSLFVALARTTNCECHPAHELDARLSLGTYRKGDPDDYDDAADDFDVFLSLQQDWQEVHVHTVRESVVRFVVNDQVRPPQKKNLEYKPMVVKKLCEQLQKMQKMKKMASQRLEFKVERGRLLKLRSEKSSFQIDRKKASVSLQQFIKEGSRFLTEKTKRILAVLLSYAVLHLHGTPWLKPNWDSSNILFFYAPSSKIPLRPFIQTQLSGQQVPPNLSCPRPPQKGMESHSHNDQSSDVDPDDMDPDDIDPDDMDPDDVDPDDIEHPFPTVVTLAVVLMELYLAAPFRELAKNRGFEFPETMDSRTRSLDIASVYNEYKPEIPQDSQFYYVIEQCLDPRTWEDEEGQKLDDQMLRCRIYQEIVRPLEDDLCDGFHFINIEELDKIAKTMDFGSWGQPIYDHQSDGHPEEPTKLPTEKTTLPQHHDSAGLQALFQHPLLVAWNQKIPDISRLPPGSRQQFGNSSEYEAAKFYDDEKPSENHTRAELEDYLNWRAKYEAVRRKFIDPHIEDPVKSPVKIAVLDSGVDDTHNALDTGQIKRKRNWTSKFKKAVYDRDGHGTFTASLLVDYAPDAELYIAKIAEGVPSPPTVIAEAIKTAVDDWKVDIISMSFGYPTNQIEGYGELEQALLYAHSRDVLLFAAASNSGANQDRAYPARDQHVICVHSTDANGNRSKFSPTALAYDPNIATIGEAVQSAWPVGFCDTNTNPDCVQCKSGTSYSTPIVVGIAAFLLQYARIHLPDKADMLKRQAKMKDMLLKIAEKTQQSISRDDYSYVSLSLFSDNLFGKDKQFIDATIGELLKG